MNTTFKLQKTDSLSPIEIILIEQIYLILNRREQITTEIVKNIDNYRKVMEAAEELRYIDSYHSTLKQMKEQFFEHASVETLRKIAFEEKFAPVYTFQDPFLISKQVLKDFGYSSEVKQDNPKAAIAKKLGAKIVA